MWYAVANTASSPSSTNQHAAVCGMGWSKNVIFDWKQTVHMILLHLLVAVTLPMTWNVYLSRVGFAVDSCNIDSDWVSIFCCNFDGCENVSRCRLLTVTTNMTTDSCVSNIDTVSTGESANLYRTWLSSRFTSILISDSSRVSWHVRLCTRTDYTPVDDRLLRHRWTYQ